MFSILYGFLRVETTLEYKTNILLIMLYTIVLMCNINLINCENREYLQVENVVILVSHM